ncbi:MAG TPA: caspase family protein, partial [Chitinophagaceae bacterium]
SKAIDGSESIDRIMYSPRGNYLLVQALDSTRVWDNRTGKHIFSYKRSSFETISADETLVASYTWDNTWVTIRRMDNGFVQHHLDNRAGYADLKFYTGRQAPLIRSVKSNVVRIWDPVTGKLLNTLSGHTDYVPGEDFSPDGRYIVTVPNGGQDGNDYTVKIWDAETSRLVHNLYDDEAKNERPTTFYTYRFAPGSRYLFLVGRRQFNDSKDGLEVFDVLTGKRLYGIYTPDHGYYTNLSINSKGNQFIFGGKSDTDTIGIYETATGKLQQVIHSGFGKISYAGFHLHDSLIVIKDSSHLQVRRNGDDSILYRLPAYLYAYDAENIFSRDGRFAATPAGTEIRIIDLGSGSVVQTLKSTTEKLNNIKWSRTGRYLLTEDDEGKIDLWDLKNGSIARQLNTWGEFSQNDDYLLAKEDKNPVIIDLATGLKLATIYAVDEAYVTVLSSGYYQSSPGASRYLYYVSGNKSLGFEQFDIKYNRPDLVLSQLGKVMGSSDTSLISNFHQAYLKRLKRQNIDPALFASAAQASVPEARLLNQDQLPFSTKDKYLRLHIQASEPSLSLSRLNVWVNEVPVWSVNGLDLSYRKRSQFDTTITLALSQGENTIEFSVSNTAGMESYRKPIKIDYVPATWAKSRIYFIGIGVNRYQDSTRNLGFASKDIRDLALEFKKRYPDSYIDTFINESATRENILAVRKQLAATTEEDIVLFSFSGHGLLDKDLNFYCAMHDMDFANPSNKGLSYSDIENLLVGIPARKKLVLLDACNSGEADSELKLAATTPDGTVAEPEKGSKGLTIRSSGSRQDSYELMRQMFANTGERNGLVVISAAGAKEYAFELNDLDNGVFTYCIKKGLFEGEADADRYNGVSVTELKNYVSRQVETITSGRQKPTTRKDNLVVDWSLSSFYRGLANSPLATVFFDSARYYSVSGNASAALANYRRVLYQLEQDSNYANLDYAYICRSAAVAEKELGDTAAALRYFFKAASVIAPFSPYSDDYDEMLSGIALSYFEMRNYDSAVFYYHQRLPVLAKVHGENSRAYANGLNVIGVTHSWQEGWDSAALYYKKAMDILVHLGKYNVRELRSTDKENYLTIVANLATAYQVLGEFAKEAEIREELVIWGDREKDAYHNWALALEKSGDVNRADSVYRDVIGEIRWRMGSEPDSSKVAEMFSWLERRATLNLRYKRYEQALAAYQDLVQFLEKHRPGTIDHGFYLNELGFVNEQLGNLEAALDGYKKSTDIYRLTTGEDTKNFRIVNGNLQRLQRKMKERD